MHVLPPEQLRLWPRLSGAAKLGLVLYGGTAVALHVGHRFSVDFDFFTEEALDRDALHRGFPFLAESSVLQEAPNAYTVLASDESFAPERIKISFFGGINIGRVGEPTLTEDGVLEVASLVDLMGTKVKVLLQRVEAKDYLDIAAMLGAGVSLPGGLAAARAMYGASFQPSESLKALTYFEGGDLEALPSAVKTALIEAASRVRDLPRVELLAGQLSGLRPSSVMKPDA